MKHGKFKAIVYVTLFFGFASFLPFIIFLFMGPFEIFDADFSQGSALLIDAGLLMIFFIHHSVFVRQGVKNRLSNLIPDEFYGAFYTNTSAAALIIMLVFWQAVPQTIAAADGIFLWILRVVFFVSIAGIYWGVKSLGAFDPFGLRKIRRIIYQKEQKNIPLTVRGAYRWMRHPLYFFMLLMIWSYPELTPDRLLFNILFTVWIIIGTILEERDLLSAFGDQYRKYRERVPMIIPYKIPGNTDII